MRNVTADNPRRRRSRLCSISLPLASAMFTCIEASTDVKAIERFSDSASVNRIYRRLLPRVTGSCRADSGEQGQSQTRYPAGLSAHIITRNLTPDKTGLPESLQPFADSPVQLVQMQRTFVAIGHQKFVPSLTIVRCLASPSKVVFGDVEGAGESMRAHGLLITEAVREPVYRGRLVLAVERYKNGEVTAGRLADLAGFTGRKTSPEVFHQHQVGDGRVHPGIENRASVGRGGE